LHVGGNHWAIHHSLTFASRGITLASVQKRRRDFKKLKQYWNLLGDSGADPKSKEAVPSDLEFFYAFDDLAREFGYEIIKPKDIKPPA
jgi:hypothetical protein